MATFIPNDPHGTHAPAPEPPSADFALAQAFLSGTGGDHRQRLLQDILAWPDERLESQHDFIQWLFPLPEPSPFNPHAPVLTVEEIALLGADPACRHGMLLALERMRRFYGVPSGGEPVKCSNALVHGGHNDKRISRMLRCLRLAGLQPQADELFRILQSCVGSRPARQEALSFWRWATYGRVVA